MNISQLASDRLIQRARFFKGSAIGIAIEDIVKIPLTTEIVADIFECLHSPDVAELKWGLWFAQGVLDSSPPKELLCFLVAELSKWMSHQSDDVREQALSLLIRLRENFPNYRFLMLKCLKDADPEVRANALAAYSTFLTNKDIPVLLEFQRDGYMSETEMGSPLVYTIRNQALAVIEALCKKQFTKTEQVEPGEADRMVYWWDWQPFLDWWEIRKSKWRFCE